jgi:branched-chain amino acid transport system permease protein
VNLQFLADGLLTGAMIGLGAIGVTLTYSILRFANFAHGEFVAWGAYFALWSASALGWLFGGAAPIGPFSFGWPLIIALAVAMPLTGLLALALDWVLFARLREKAGSITVVMASFGASMALRSGLEFLFTSRPGYFSRDLQIAMRFGWGLRVTPDQLACLALTLLLVVALNILLTRTHIGRSMRAVSENPSLARVAGVDVDHVIRVTWLLGGALACASGVMVGVLVQIRPYMGFDLLLPLFAAAILGGIGSVPGALIGGLIVGVAEAGAAATVGAQWRSAAAFALLIAMLLARPNGLLGARE